MRIEIINLKTLKLLLVIVGMLVFANVAAAPKDFELHQAVLDNDLQLVSKFLSKGADVNQIGSRKYGYGSALHLAVREGRLKIAQLLLKRGAQVDVLDPDDFTPLHNAAWNGNLDMIKLLLEAGADIEASTYDGDTPLTLAQNNDQPKVAEFIQAKLQPSATSETKVEQTSAEEHGVADISGTYAIAELTYSREVHYFKDWAYAYLGVGKNLELTIQQSGSTVTGVFSGDLRGTIKGVIDRNEITFGFDGAPRRGGSTFGEGVLFLSEDSTELIGTFDIYMGFFGALDGKWSFRKIQSVVAQVPDISGTYIAETTASHIGSNHSLIRRFKKLNGKLIVLKQTGNTITGSISSESSWRINGTRKGNIINFYIIRFDEIVGSWEINADATNLEGKWHTDGAGGASGKWNLTKIETEKDQVVDLTGTYRADIEVENAKFHREVRIVQNGNQITASSGVNGRVYGGIDGDTIRFEYQEHGFDLGSTGKGKWTIKPGGKKIEGTFFSTIFEKSGTWNLTKIEDEPAQVVDVSGTYTAEITYDSKPPGSYDWYFGKKPNIEVKIEQNAKGIIAKMTGDISGKIEGAIEGHRITFSYYAVSQRGGSISGTGIWVLSDDQDTINGTWDMGGQTGKWNLMKIE